MPEEVYVYMKRPLFTYVFLFVLVSGLFISSVGGAFAATGVELVFTGEDSEPGADSVEEVSIDTVTLPEGGFVALYIDGELYGVSDYLSAGEKYEDHTVELSKSIERESTVIAIAYRDGDNNQQFNQEADSQYMDGDYAINSAGNINFVEEETTPVPEEPKEPEPSPIEQIDTKIIVGFSICALIIFGILASVVVNTSRISLKYRERF